MATHASREEMLAAFGPYSVAFEPIGKHRNPYLSLMHLAHDRASTVVTTIRDVALSGDTETYVVAMLRDINWRPHLVAAVSTHYQAYPAAISQMWAALDAGSWVTPQLAAVLSVCDSGFVQNAIDRLNLGCPLSNDPEYQIESATERHSAQGPSGSTGRSAKSASSLFAILQSDSPNDQAVAGLSACSDLQQIISTDLDNGGRIATSWREKLLAMDTQT